MLRSIPKLYGYFSQYQINNKEVSSFLTKSSLNHFDLLKDQIKFVNPNITKYDLMKQFMIFFKDQITQSFNKKDSSMGSIKDSEKGILVGEGQVDENFEDEEEQEQDKNSFEMNIHDLQEYSFEMNISR